MLKQQQSDEHLLKSYGRIIAMSVLLLVLGALGYRHFTTVPHVVGQSLAIEHTRLLNTLAMVKSQWLSNGRPNKMQLNWEKAGQYDDQVSGLSRISGDLDADLTATQNWILLSQGGWPILFSNDVTGCKQFWYSVTGAELTEIEVFIDAEQSNCRYTAPDKASLSYQFSTGRVIFIPSNEEK